VGPAPRPGCALIVAEIAQVAAGAQRVLAVQIPLGVGIVAAAVALGVRSFRPAARRATYVVALIGRPLDECRLGLAREGIDEWPQGELGREPGRELA
jgi:hypothetical protein